uniref:Paladin-like n=1 Tax=Callorhinchus milii TaxID=7868 RepID=A0A4W3HHD5_CALMI
MGTTASASQQRVPTAAQPNSTIHKPSAAANQSEDISTTAGKAKSIITNNVSPVVITYNLKEEFQIHDDFLKAHYITGRINDKLPEHFLVQGKYFMVKDLNNTADVLLTLSNCGAPNFRQSQGDYPVYGMGQPTVNGFCQVLHTLKEAGYQEIICFNVREDPVLFLPQEDDFIPYTPRDRNHLQENLYYLYIEQFVDEPHVYKIQHEEDVHVSEEVYRPHAFTQTSFRYKRLALPIDGSPEEADFDTFISTVRESPSLTFRDSVKPPPALVFNCQSGVGRTNLGMTLGALIMAHRTAFPHSEKCEKNKGPFQIVQNYINAFPNGSRIVTQVNSIISMCSQMHDLKESISFYKNKLEGLGEMQRNQGLHPRKQWIKNAFRILERYFYLIAFNSYLYEQYPLAFTVMFSTWMRRNPFFYRQVCEIPISEMKLPIKLISKQLCVLVADDYLDLDEMSSQRQMKVSNFRKVSKMPVCGIAQPSTEGLAQLLSYLTDDKRKFTSVLCVNLREEAVLAADEQMYSLRDVANLQQETIIPAATVEQLENAAKMDILTCKTTIEVWQEDKKEMKVFSSCLTLNDVYNQMALRYSQLYYQRIPVTDCAAPTEEDFDSFLKLVSSTLTTDSNSAIVLNCHDGKERTTVAMVICVLITWHIKGFPEALEEELISVPDAKYTKGEFEAILQLVRILPNGNEMKKEVDRALDAVSDSMTPMMHHLRELIINIYRKVQFNSLSQNDGARLHLRSLQYLERYFYLILFNAYLHLEKQGGWQRSFKVWITEVAAPAGVFEILDKLGFSEFEDPEDTPMCRMRYRWQQQHGQKIPCWGKLFSYTE